MDEKSGKKNKTEENGKIELVNPKKAKDGKLVKTMTLGAAPEKAKADDE